MGDDTFGAGPVYLVAVALAALCGVGCGAEPSTREEVGVLSSAVCHSSTLALSPASPAPLNGTVTLTSSASCDTPNVDYRFAWQVAGTPATIGVIQEWSTNNVATWDTTGLSGAYNLYAYARQTGGSAFQSHTTARYLVGRVCNAVSIGVSPAAVSGQSPTLGTPITLTGAATCLAAGTPEYQFYYIPPGTGSYVQIPQTNVDPGGWGGASATLDTSALGPGRYGFQVRARAADNSSAYESTASGPASYYVGDVCPQVTLAAAPVSPQPRGGTVALTASATCLRSATPEYKFSYKLDSASTYTDIRSWGGPSVSWNTASLGAGTYHLQVQTRGVGNASAAEGYTVAGYTLTGGFAIANNAVAQVQIYRGSHERSQNAAQDLSATLQQMTGGTFIPQTLPGTLPSAGIFVVDASSEPSVIPASVQWPSGADPTIREAFVIKQIGSQLWLVGKTELAVRHAVNRLLHALGYRWFFQGRNWEVVPSKPTLSYSGDTVSDQPRMVTRSMSGMAFAAPLNAAGHSQEVDQREWRKRNGLSYDYTPPGGAKKQGNTAVPLTFGQYAFGSKVLVGPAVYNFIYQANDNVLSECAGSWFEDDPSRYGQLSPNPFNTIEIAKQEVRDCFWAWLTKYSPTTKFDPSLPQVLPAHASNFSIEPGDGTHAISRSSAALALGNDVDQLVYLANDLLARIAANPSALPQRYVTMLGGYYHALPPQLQTANPNFIVGVMPLKQYGLGPYVKTSDLMAAWAARGASVGLWENYSFKDRGVMGVGYSQSFSGQTDFLNDSVAMAREYQEQGVAGSKSAVLATEDNFGRYGLGYYLTARLMWDPNADVEALRTDFFDRAFPTSSSLMRQYYELFNPRDKPLLVTTDTLGIALDLLKQAGEAAGAASSTAEVARINDLKSFMHHGALWWRIQRAPLCVAPTCTISDPQPSLVLELLNWDYRNRHSYMTSYQQDQILGWYGGARQFGLAQFSTTPYSWENGALLTASDVATAFATDLLLFPRPSTPVAQLSWGGDPVAVSEFGTTTAAYDPSSAGRELAIALYTNAGGVSLQVKTGRTVNSFAEDFPNEMIPKIRIRLTDQLGRQLLNTLGEPLTRTLEPHAAGAAYEPVPFPNIAPPPGVPMGANFGVVARIDAGGYKAVVHTTPQMRAATMLDKSSRPLNVGSPSWGYYFYVPKGTTQIKFTWNRSGMVTAAHFVSTPFTPPTILDDLGAVQTVSNNRPQEIATVQVPAGRDGKLWRAKDLNVSQLWFYNVPNYFSASPSSMLLPRELVATDGLTALP